MVFIGSTEGVSGVDLSRGTWLVPTVEKFPRSQKFLLGDRMPSTALDVSERLIEATDTKARQMALLDAKLGSEKLNTRYLDPTDMPHGRWTSWAG
jgi:hypothetical protein